MSIEITTYMPAPVRFAYYVTVDGETLGGFRTVQDANLFQEMLTRRRVCMIDTPEQDAQRTAHRFSNAALVRPGAEKGPGF